MVLKDASREVRLQWFARAVIEATFEGLDVEGDAIQQWAKMAGLVDERTATAADIAARDKGGGPLAEMENSECMSEGDTWFVFSRDLKDENVRWHELAST